MELLKIAKFLLPMLLKLMSQTCVQNHKLKKFTVKENWQKNNNNKQ